MKPRIELILFCLFAAVLPGHTLALTNNYDTLIIETGETFYAAGTVYKNVSIHVKSGGTLALPIGSFTDQDQWRLQLIAPWVKIEGRILATGASSNTQGCGLPGNNFQGPGGSGYGNAGGRGDFAPGSGGPAYDTAFLENPGSKGINNPNGGGGSIRIDALSLTLGASAILAANAYPLATSGGGGSGGCVFLNGVHCFLTMHYALQATGGAGQVKVDAVATTGLATPVPTATVTATPQPAGGGGAGGRVKIYTYPSFFNGTGTISLTGGLGGGGTAKEGGDGVSLITPAPTPSAPQLIAPLDGQTVGQNPTLTFSGADPMLSRFLQYHIQIALSGDINFLTPVVSSEQSSQEPGWNGRLYYASNEVAGYTCTTPLAVPQTFIWRVRVRNGQDWSAFSVIRQFSTTNNNPPSLPLLVYPALGQTLVSKTPALNLFCSDPDGNSLTYAITLSQDPNLYNARLFQATYPGWDKTSYPSGTTATCQILNTVSYPDALQPGATYFWRATAFDFYLGTSASAIGQFTVVGLPAAPVLVSPADQNFVTTKNPYLTLNASSPTNGMLRYKLELSSDNFQTVITFLSESSPGWSKPEYASSETASLHIPEAYTLVPGKTYGWRALVYDLANDNWSPVSSPSAFQVITPPLLPQLISPPDGNLAPDGAIPLNFSAVSESGNTLAYRCDLSADAFQSVLFSADQTQSTIGWSAPFYASGATALYTLPASLGLERGKTYAWRVQACDGLSWGPFSETRTFSLANQLEIRRFKIYPSPAVRADALRIELELSVDADVTVRLMNLLGREIKHQTWALRGGSSPQTVTLDISALASGSYFCTLEAKSIFGTKKSVKRFAVVN